MTNAITTTAPPSSKEEQWRYTPVQDVMKLAENTVRVSQDSTESVNQEDLRNLIGNIDSQLFLFVDGYYSPKYSSIGERQGLICGTADDIYRTSDDLVAKVENIRTIDGLKSNGDDHDVAVIKVQDSSHIKDTVHIVHLSTSGVDGPQKRLVHPRTIIDVGSQSSINVIEIYCGFDNDSISDVSTTINIGESSNVDICRIQIESPKTIHIGSTQVNQGENSSCRLVSVSIGSDISRNAIDAHLDSTGATIELSGVNLTNSNQRHDTVVTVRHEESNCSSNQKFIGVVDDRGHSAFSGEIIVEKNTVGTDAHQLNKNLVLSNDAKIDSQPWLRIFADDVQCTHGSSVGRLDEQALFYLRCRGIELSKAREMMIDAFIRDITDNIENEDARKYVSGLMEKYEETIAALQSHEEPVL